MSNDDDGVSSPAVRGTSQALAPGGGWVPVPDPTKLTDEAISRATVQYRRELDAMRQLLAERIDAASTEQSREGQSLKELIEQRLAGMDKATELLAATVGRVPSDTDKQVNALRELLGTRIDGMDEATKLLAIGVREVPTDITKATSALREVLRGEIRNVQDVAIEKFLAIDGTFSSNALALTAALAAQKEAAAEQNKSNTLAITKSEVATKEKIDSNALQTATSLKSLADRLDDLKERVDKGEGSTSGQAAVLGSPFEAATFRQSEQTATQANQRAAIAQVIAVIAVLASIVTVIVLITKK